MQEAGERERRRREEIDAHVAEVQVMLRGRMAAVAGELSAELGAGANATPNVASAVVNPEGDGQPSVVSLPTVDAPQHQIQQFDASSSAASHHQSSAAAEPFGVVRAGSMWDRLYR